MASEVRVFTLTIPAGTTQAAPVTQPTAFPPRVVDAVQVIVPLGPSGLVGWRILVGNTQVIPYLSDPWVITAGESITWPLESYPDSGAWSVQGYNSGAQPHAVYFRFLLSQLGAQSLRGADVISNDVLSFASDGG